MKDANVKRASWFHTVVYQATNGFIGRRLVHNDMLLLTTKGRKTGNPHTVPLLYLLDGETIVVIASYGGRPNHPEWYLNLVAEPEAEIQILGSHRNVRASTMTGVERSEWWSKAVEAFADYATYQSRTDREIPLLQLSPS